MNLETKVVIDNEFKYKENKIDSTHCIEIKSKSDPSIQTSNISKEKVSSFESIGSSKHHAHNDKCSNANTYSKEQIFASMMDPLMLFSMNYLSTLTPTELHNCVTLHKQSVAFNSCNNPIEHAHINKKQKISTLNSNITKKYNPSQSTSSISLISELFKEKS